MKRAAVCRVAPLVAQQQRRLSTSPFGTLLPKGPDPEGHREFSVVYTDRAVNHMSQNFQGTMNELNSTLKGVYNADACVIIPGSGSYGMEAVVRQFAIDKKCLVVRNGWFSYRWTQIFESLRTNGDHTVMKARRIGAAGPKDPFEPAPISEVVDKIKSEKPAVVFAPHVETAAGIILPDDYIKAVAEATHSVGGLFVLDGIASGCLWVDMKALGVDMYISAPQKGWSGPACAALVMMGPQALERLDGTASNSFVVDLKKWHQVMQAYEKGGHMYHATMPTDALTQFRDVLRETKAYGLDKVQEEQWALGNAIRGLLKSRGIQTISAQGFEAPGVVVNFTDNAELQTGKKFLSSGVQIAGGVPLQCDEGADFKTWRVGLFGLDKLHNCDRMVSDMKEILDKIGA